MWLSRRLVLGLIPSVLVLAGLIYAQLIGASFPVPFLALLAAVVVAAASGGRLGGLIAGVSGSALIFYSYAIGFGPASLIGSVWTATLGATLFLGAGYWLGLIRDQRDKTLHELTLHQQSLQATLDRETEKNKRTIAEIAQHEARLLTAIRIAGLGHYTFNSRTGICEFCSEQHARHFGLTPEEFRIASAGPDPELFYVHPDDRRIVIDAIRRIKFGETTNFEYRALHKNGETRFIREIVEPNFDAEGNVDLEVGTSMDLTDLRRAEAKLRENQKLEAIGRLTAGVAHDFNNLLAVIMGNLELLDEVETKTDRDEMVAAALGATLRGAALTGQLLSFGRKAQLAPEHLNVSATIRDLYDLFRRTIAAPIEIVLRVEHQDCFARLDRPQLESALLNLIVNASDTMSGGGTLTIGCDQVALLARDMRNTGLELEPGPYVAVSIADTGEGMADAVRSRVFEPFFATKDVGTGSGLGLSMVQGFVKQSGGDVRIETAIGKGTTVTLFFRPADGAAAQITPDATRHDDAVGEACVLVVEDDDAVRRTTTNQLKSLGYTVIEAANGQAGLDALRANADVAILLSDVVMPGPLQGPHLASQSMALRPDLKVILMSGYHDFNAVDPDGPPIAYPVLSKPIRRSDLNVAICEALSHRVPAPAPVA